MSSYACYVLSRRGDIDELSDDIDEFLGHSMAERTRTRRGRVWDVMTPDGRPMHVRVCATIDVLIDVEDDLLHANLLPEDAPLAIAISTALGRPVDQRAIKSMAVTLAQLADGVATPPTT